MKKIAIVLLLVLVASAAEAQVACQRIGDFTCCNNGQSVQQLGNFDYYSNGATGQRLGNFYYYTPPPALLAPQPPTYYPPYNPRRQ